MKAGDTVTLVHQVGPGQRRETATVEKVVEIGLYQLLMVKGRVFSRHYHQPDNNYHGGTPDGAPLTLVLP